mgnify:CR=1 FL=1
MKIALVTDLHFGARNDNQKVAEFQKKFYDDVFFPYLDKHDIQTVIDLGDTFDRRKFISYTSLKAAKEMFFDPLKHRGINTHIIVGNHDVVYKNTLEVNSIDLLLEGYPAFNEYSSPAVITIDGLDILLMPWICKDNFDQCWDLIRNSSAQVCMGHLELNGFQMYKGMPSYEGWDAEEFGKFDQVFSGHYHHRSTTGNITYLGTAYEMTWSCFEDEKGFHVYDTETRELEFISNPNKLFYKVFYDDVDMSYDHLDTYDFEELAGKYVKMVIKNKTNPVIFDMFVNGIENVGPINLQVVEDHLNLDLEDDEDIIDEAEDTLTILDTVIEGLDLKSDKYELRKMMHNLYNEALTVE